MQLVADLTYVYERCRSVALIVPSQAVRVKGENFIVQILARQFPIVQILSRYYPTTSSVTDSMRNWIAYLDKRYAEQVSFLGPPVDLEYRDAERLVKDVRWWMDTIVGAYADQGTVLIKEETIETILPRESMAKLDNIAREDLDDGVNCILHLLPTPGAMILLRVAENIVRRYYVKVTGKSAEKVSWGDILKELEQSQQVEKPLIGYLQYLKQKRNEAEHPDKRFSQEEAERVLIQVKGLLEEVSESL